MSARKAEASQAIKEMIALTSLGFESQHIIWMN